MLLIARILPGAEVGTLSALLRILKHPPPPRCFAVSLRASSCTHRLRSLVNRCRFQLLNKRLGEIKYS
jgi:hypothetical protein